MPHNSLSPYLIPRQDKGNLSFVALMHGTTFLTLGGILKKAREKVT